MSKFFPDVAVNRVTDIDQQLLEQLGVSALIVDIDNTLTTHNNPDISKDVLQWVNRMREQGTLLILVSNNNVPRVQPFADNLGLPFVANAKKPLSSGFARAQNLIGLPVQQIAMVGDQIFTDMYGGNRFGYHTILVTPIQEEGNLFFRFKRWAEGLVLNRYKKQKEKNR